MLTIPPYLIEPIWEQFAALLPEREESLPPDCHNPRIPDRVVSLRNSLRFWSSAVPMGESPTNR